MGYDYLKTVDFFLDWYGLNARILPWRSDPKPYYVWVSEIMLQQTRVEAVKGYFERFVEALPDVTDSRGGGCYRPEVVGRPWALQQGTEYEKGCNPYCGRV